MANGQGGNNFCAIFKQLTAHGLFKRKIYKSNVGHRTCKSRPQYINVSRGGGGMKEEGSRELGDLGLRLAYVHHVDLVAGMYPAYVSAHIRRMSRSVDAVGTIKPR